MDLGIWDKLARAIVVLLLLAVALGVLLWYLPEIRRNERMRKEIYTLEGEIRREEETNRWLRLQIESTTTPRTIERLAREQMSYARTGETVIRFVRPATNPPPAGPSTNPAGPAPRAR